MLARISPAGRLAIYFFLFGTAWILATGKIASWASARNFSTLRFIEDFKGLLFVLVASLVIYTLARRIYRKLLRSVDENKEMIRKYRAVMTATREGIYEYDIKSGIVKLSENIKEILGEETTIKEDGREYWRTHIHPEDRERVFSEIAKAFQPGQNFWQGEYRFLKGGTNYIEVLHRIFVLKDKDEAPYSLIGAVQDITAQRQLQREYHAQQLKSKTEITRNIIKAEERERNRWAEELHDSIAQMLGVVKLYMGMIAKKTDEQKELVDKTMELVEQSINEIRQLSANLKPPVFQEQGLKDAIRNLVSNISRFNNLQISLEIDEADCNRYLNEEQKLMIYRIVQEQLNNIVKYASARNVLIRVDIQHPTAVITIRDDGVGFEPDELQSGIGLKNIRGRLNLFNGHLEIKSGKGKGCELRSEFLLN